MLLLLMLGAGSVVATSERAYANVSYALVGGSDSSLALVTPTDDSVTLTTDAYPSEE